MRIAIVGPAHPLRGGGISSFNERLALHFQSEGYHVDIYSFSLQYPNFLFPGKSQYTDEPAPKNLNIFTKINSVNPFNWYKVGKELREKKYDLLIVRFWMPFFAPCLGYILKQVRKNKSSKIVCIADNIIPHEKRWGDKMLIRFFLGKLDGCVTMSQSVMKDLKSIDPSIPTILADHPLYDNYGDKVPKSVARQRLDIPAEDKILLFFGFIRRYKGLDMLLDALANERISQIGVKLLIAGEFYGEKEYYLQKIKELKLEDRIFLHTHFIANAEVATYFSASDAVVLPYRSATQSGITQIAYHFDIPMIATDVGGLPELVKDGRVGWIVPSDEQGIALGIQKFYKDDISLNFIENIQKDKKKYSWEVFGHRILSFLE